MSEEPFITHRSLLFTVAYEILGVTVDAEDVVQETWLRWSGVDKGQVRDARAYLVRTVTRQAIDRLRALSLRRETYVGQWLPEPLLTSPDVAEDVILAENVSTAMLTVLETLGPVERAVFVLHEVFEVSYDEIAQAVQKTPAATRQIAHRARKHVAARRPRVSTTRAEQQAAVASFQSAVQDGDIQGLLEVLAPEVVYLADGGGLAQAARQPVLGAERVARMLLGLIAKVPGGSRLESVIINGTPGLQIEVGGALDTMASFSVENGQITRIYVVRNPDKLSRLIETKPLSRATK